MHAIQRNAGSSAEQVFTLDREKLEWLSPAGISASHNLYLLSCSVIGYKPTSSELTLLLWWAFLYPAYRSENFPIRPPSR
jgi:hypothetical protein